MSNTENARQSGFTLLEIMIVLVIIGLLSAMILPNILSKQEQAQFTKVKSDIVALESALTSYKLDNYRFPTTDQGLEALVRRPDVSPEPKNYPDGGYIRRLPNDPWDNPYQYIQPGENGPFDVWTLGADGAPGGEGDNQDIGNWNLDQAGKKQR